MRRRCGQSGMSLMEVLVALAVILILISALIGVGSGIKTRAQIDQTRATLETLSTALAQYYSDFGKFPFDTDAGYDKDALESAANGLDGKVEPPIVTLVEKDGGSPPLDVSTASSAALFYFLDKNPSSRSIVETVANSGVTNKDDAGTEIKFRPASGAADGSDDVDLPRYIDPWKMSIRYEYLPGTAFPTLTSAGPDKIFDTPDDITSK